jgi:hypothetical protein
MIDRYELMSDSELEEAIKDRADGRGWTPRIEEREGEGVFAAFEIPSPFPDESAEPLLLLSAEGTDRRRVLIGLLWSDDLNHQPMQWH